jgi:hypothetical protein
MKKLVLMFVAIADYRYPVTSLQVPCNLLKDKT